MMNDFTSIRMSLCLAIIGLCSVVSASQAPEANKLIEEINTAKVKARELVDKAEEIRKKAREKSEAGDRLEHDKLIDEAAKAYAQISDTLKQAADKADEISKFKQPEWYEEYFSLHSKLIRNLAETATAAHDELLVRKNGLPSESQVQSWKEHIDRTRKENDDFRKRIAAIESREGVVLIKQ